MLLAEQLCYEPDSWKAHTLLEQQVKNEKEKMSHVQNQINSNSWQIPARKQNAQHWKKKEKKPAMFLYIFLTELFL